MKTPTEILREVHTILADFYDEELERNEINAKRNVLRIIKILVYINKTNFMFINY